MASATRTQAVPTLPGIPKEAADQIRVLTKTVQRLSARIGNLEGSGFLTADQAEAKYGPATMAKELSANGSAPLNVVTVAGRMILQPQPAKGR